MLADGRLHLTAVAKLAPHLTAENREALLARAVHRSKREIEELLAKLAPRPDAPAGVRRLPSRPVAVTVSASLVPASPVSASPGPAPGSAAARPPTGPDDPRVEPSGPQAGAQLRPDAVATRPTEHRPAVIEPLAPARYRVQFTASAELRDKLERLQALMRSSVPDGDLAAVIDAAVTEKLERLEAGRFGRVKAPRKSVAQSDPSPRTRRIPAAVRRAVWERDGGRCRYVDAEGRRCPAREGLELHHRRPFGFGGGHAVENVALDCRTHNALMAEVDYGRWGRPSTRVVSGANGSAREAGLVGRSRPAPSPSP
jgi:hypothetical protein